MSKCFSVRCFFIYTEAKWKHCQQQLTRTEIKWKQWVSLRETGLGFQWVIKVYFSLILQPLKANQHRSHMQTGSSCSCHCCRTRSGTLLGSEFDVFIYVGECLSTKLFIISIPWAAWTNELFQPNNSAIGERYWTQLQHRIIHRQQREAKQLGSHLHYENEKQSLVKEHYTHATRLPLFQPPVKWSCAGSDAKMISIRHSFQPTESV